MFEKELEAMSRIPVVGPYWAFLTEWQLGVADAFNLLRLRALMAEETPHDRPGTPLPMAEKTRHADAIRAEDLSRAA